jgi:Fe-S cluster assembly protein SufB
MTTADQLAGLGRYEYGWADSDTAGASARRGLNEDVVRDISAKKSEPQWMLDLRLKGLRLFDRKPMPAWGADLSHIDFDNIKYFVRSTEKQAASWDELPEDIKSTYDKLGIPEAEKQRLIAGVAAQYESEVVYHKIREDLEEQGVVFLDTDTALKEHEELFKEYFGTVIPVGDNKFAALNTSVWSGGSFIYVPKGVHVEIPLQAYFRINTENMGQFERTLIIVDEGAYVHYVEGCTAPIYSSDSLHSAVVEIVVKKNARCRYTTIQNWSTNVYNLVTKRAVCHEGATMEWIDGNLGSKTRAPRWCTPRRTPPRPSCRSRSRAAAAARRTAASCRCWRARTTRSPRSSATRCWWTPSPARTPTPTSTSARTTCRWGTRRPSRRSATTSCST